MNDFFDYFQKQYVSNKKLVLNIAFSFLGICLIALTLGIISTFIHNRAAKERATAESSVKLTGTVEVLNGSGKNGQNEPVISFLREKGLDVVHSGNYRITTLPTTIVIIRNGNSAPAYYIARLLSLDSSQVVQIQNKDYLVDATIILGKDISLKKL